MVSHKAHRNVTRSVVRQPVRSLNRFCLRGRRRGPDDLTQAFTAFSRAIGAHRRLARLAPRFFDSAVVNREALERAEKRRWMAVWEPALRNAYGGVSEPPDPDDGMPPLPALHTRRAVQRWLTEHQFWMEAGRTARERHKRRHPHAPLSLSRMARWLRLAFDLKRLACGLDTAQPPPVTSNDDQAWAELKRSYGHQLKALAERVVVPAPVTPASPPSAAIGPDHPVTPASPPASAPSPPRPPRCDTWSRQTRYLRRMIS